MNEITNFDVLIVYSEKLANSASSVSGVISAPFSKGSNNESYNLVYGYFLKTCQKNNLKAAFTTSADIVGAGKCQSYWLFKKNAWIKVKKAGFSKLIFEKIDPNAQLWKFCFVLNYALFKAEFLLQCTLPKYREVWEQDETLPIRGLVTIKNKTERKLNDQYKICSG